jgi:glycosyltransferase involved in cell wall biosynthesis
MDLRYTIVGDGPYEAQLKQEIAAFSMCERVTLTGSLGESDVADLLRAHDIFLLPSVGLGEAAPVSVMEAMACGLPVIACIIGSTPAMIRDEESGFLVPQEDAGAIEAVLSRLVVDLALRTRIGQAARTFAVEQFDVRASSLRLLEHIRRWSPAAIGTALD